MLIDLRNIKPSSQPIRSSWDEDKMNELAQSIKEQGVIVPIKVRIAPEIYENCETVAHQREQHEKGQWNWGDLCCWEMEQQAIEKYGPPQAEPAFDYCDYCERLLHPDNWADWEHPGDPEDGLENLEPRPYFEIVYGHRRAEAARRAGLAEIECIVEGMEDSDALVQALIENVQREDMQPIDKARAIKKLQAETGWTFVDFGKRGIISEQMAGKLVSMLALPEDIQAQIGDDSGHVGPDHRERPLTLRHVIDVTAAGGHDDRVAILRKAADEGLTANETRTVAQAYRDAKTQEERDAVLKVRGDHPAFERAVQVQAGVDWADSLKARATERKHQENDAEVAQFFDAMRSFNMVVETVMAAVDFGKFSPEGARFAIRRIDSLITKLQELKEQLNNE